MVDRDRKLESALLDDEPLGIIISRGSRAEEVPRFAAYVWGPVPSEGEGATPPSPAMTLGLAGTSG